MPFDRSARLWPTDGEEFFRELATQPLRQQGPHCVSTCLAILSGATPESFQGQVNTQDPVSWSQALLPFGMKLAYCPTDVRKLRYYLPELLEHDDLFTLSYYAAPQPQAILQDPNASGWIIGSHIVILHRGMILDPATGTAAPALDHHCGSYHTKRIFRVVPAGHGRGL